jgi:hypothetical protein
MGSGSVFAQVPRAGNEYILEWAPAFKTLASFGLWVRPWIRVDYPNVSPAVGNFEATFFEPTQWRPEYPNPAFDNMRADDAFWGARLVARFSDEAIRAIVAKANYSDPAAADYITTVLIARRDKVLRAWLTGVNPVVEPALAADGTFTFRNAAVDAKVATPPAEYQFEWSAYDNATASAVGPASEGRNREAKTMAPADILQGREFVRVLVRTMHPDHPVWQQPVTVFFRRTAQGWRAVGLER